MFFVISAAISVVSPVIAVAYFFATISVVPAVIVAVEKYSAAKNATVIYRSFHRRCFVVVPILPEAWKPRNITTTARKARSRINLCHHYKFATTNVLTGRLELIVE